MTASFKPQLQQFVSMVDGDKILCRKIQCVVPVLWSAAPQIGCNPSGFFM